jgi:TrmH family RNA methyltransferase
VEGTELVRTALAAGAVPESLFVAAEGAGDPAVGAVAAEVASHGIRVYDLAPGVLARVADTVTPQPVVGVFPMVHADLAAVAGDGTLVVVLDGVRDPGNAGTVLRSADAAGVDAVVFGGRSVDPYNPKTVRSSAGSIFHVPLAVEPDTASALTTLGDLGYRALGAAVGGDEYTAVDWNRPTAIVLGNEAAGLDPTLELDGSVGIALSGRAESLNVGVACAVLCFEARRRRSSTMPR